MPVEASPIIKDSVPNVLQSVKPFRVVAPAAPQLISVPSLTNAWPLEPTANNAEAPLALPTIIEPLVIASNKFNSAAVVVTAVLPITNPLAGTTTLAAPAKIKSSADSSHNI